MELVNSGKIVVEKHKLKRYTDEYVDIVLLYPALVVYSLTSKCIQGMLVSERMIFKTIFIRIFFHLVQI